jgi:hypothetical protein
MALPVLPADLKVLLDASSPSSLTLAGGPAQDGWFVDASQGGALTQNAAPTGWYWTPLPTYDLYNLAGGPAMVLGGPGVPALSSPAWMNITLFAFQIPFTLVLFERAAVACTMVELSTNIGAAQGVLLSSTTGPSIQIRGPGGNMTADVVAGAGWNTDNVARLLILKCDGTKAGTSLTSNGVPVPITTAGVDPGVGIINTPGFLGADHAAANQMTGAIGFFGVVPGRLTTAGEDASLLAYIERNAQNGTWYIPPAAQPKTRNLISMGDGNWSGSLPSTIAPIRAGAVLGSRTGVVSNFAIDAAGLINVIVGVPSDLTQWTNPGGGRDQIVAGMPNIVMIGGGEKDSVVLNAANPNYGLGTLPGSLTIGGKAGYWDQLIAQIVSDLQPIAGGPHLLPVCPTTVARIGPWERPMLALANDRMRTRVQGFSTSNVKVRLVDVGASALKPGDRVLGDWNFYNSLGFGEIALRPPYWLQTSNLTPSPCAQERWGGLLARAMIQAGL